MDREQLNQEIDHLYDYIVQTMERSNAQLPEALAIMAAACSQVMESMCNVTGEDYEEMIRRFCNALQGPLEGERVYLTGDKSESELLNDMVDEIKAGGNIEEIVDKYTDNPSPELRQQLIDGFRQAVGNHMLKNIRIK